jgi:hypothetical protein
MRALEGVPGLPGCRRGRECNLIGCLEAVLRYHAESYDYVDLMGLSAAAFRVRLAYSTSDAIMGGRIHPGISVDPLVGPHMELLARATGYALERDGHFMHDFDVHVVAERIEKEIDAGRPVIAMNMRNASDWGVIVGYDPDLPADDGEGGYPPERLLCHTYYDFAGPLPQRVPSFPWNTFYVRREREPLARELAVRASLEWATTLLTTQRQRVDVPTGWLWHYQPEHWNGIAAYEAWIEDLRDEEGIAGLSPDQFLNYWQGHACMYNQLRDARCAAAEYLRRIASGLAPGQAQLASAASHVYDQMVELLARGWGCFPFRAEGYVEPGMGWWLVCQQAELEEDRAPAYAEQWTPAMRAGAVDVLHAARGKEEEALAAVKELSRALQQA